MPTNLRLTTKFLAKKQKNMKLRCLIIDDEPLAQRVLEKYIAELSGLELVGKCGDAIEAMEVLKKEEIDLIFLDINMPRLDGINFP